MNTIKLLIRKKFGNHAFTLIELLVVIALIAILTAIILPSLANSRVKARDGQRVSDVGQLQLALALYFDRCHAYPTPDTTTNSSYSYIDPTVLAGANCPISSGTVNLSSFISKVPTPPSGAGQTYYDYLTDSTYDNYVLHAKLESTNVVSANGLSSTALTGLTNPTPITCDNSATSKDYCIGPK